MYDVAIIGAGPAGATLARLLGDRCKVLLIDRRRLDDPPDGRRGKCCGGLLAPDAQRMLGRRGLGLPAGVLVEPQVFLVRAMEGPGAIDRCYQRHYINIDRERFDRWLVSLAPGDVDRRFGCRAESVRRDGSRVSIALRTPTGRAVGRAHVVVGADGAGSLVRASLGLRGPRRYIGVQHWFETASATPHFSAIFDPDVTDFYSWTIPKAGALIVGSALRASPDATERFDRLVGRLRARGMSLGRCFRREAAPLLRPTGPTQISLGTDNVALVGEAAGFISPSSAEGISYALASGALLADALRPGLAGAARRYRRLTRPLRRNIALKALKSRLIYTPAIRHALLASGLGSVTVGRGASVAHPPRRLALRPGDIL